MTKWAVWALCVGLLASTSCAGYAIQENGTGPGYDVYRPEPYLQGTPTVFAVGEKGEQKVLAYSFTIVWLPNYSKRYRVHSWSGLGKADFAFTYTDGWKLTAVADKGDNTAVLSAITDLVKHVLPANPFGISKSEAKKTSVAGIPPEPVLYKIEFDECTGAPTCLRRIDFAVGPPCSPPAGVRPPAQPPAKQP